MSNDYWLKENRKFLNLIKPVKIPNSDLNKVENVLVKNTEKLNQIPKSGGAYWIWTNEPVRHFMHKHKTPKKINNGEIIYNGIAKDNVRGRIEKHLFSQPSQRWSGISIDIYFNRSSRSHKKQACSANNKVPYVIKNKKIGKIKIVNKKLLLRINLSKKEREFIKRTNYPKYFFRNGTDIREIKHKNYKFKVYYITGINQLYLDYIEKEWRAKYGLPKLCSYSSGR